MLNRSINILELLQKKASLLLFGARGTGKSTLAEQAIADIGHRVLKYDLLNFDIYQRFLISPHLFRLEIEKVLGTESQLLVFVDEIQKGPPLLDEIHHLLETYKKRIQFFLTGSSARKLKRSSANMLAGRALSLRLHPLCSLEFQPELTQVLRLGSLPGIIIDNEFPELALKAYVSTYLKEEVLQESLVRRIDGFTRFLELAAQYHGEPINASSIGRAAGLSPNTVLQYFQILEDTLVGWMLPGWNASVRKQLRTAPKFYFFDNGVANALRGELNLELTPSSGRFGKLFESWLVQECFRINDYQQLDLKFSYWRTNTNMEVDLVVSRGASQPIAAIEIKSNTAPSTTDLHGLRAFANDYPNVPRYLFCCTPRSLELEGIAVMPWVEGLGILKRL